MESENSEGELTPAERESEPQSKEMISRFLDLQAEEIATRRDELELESKANHQNHEFAKAALAAQVEDRKSERQYQAGESTKKYVLAAVVIIAVFCFTGYLASSGNSELVLEILKIVAYFLAGGLSGYGYRAIKQPREIDTGE